MNPIALLGLLSFLFEQLTIAQQEIVELRQALAGTEPSA